MLAEKSPPMKHPPPDLLTNPKFDRNKEMEFQGLHKGNSCIETI